LSRRPREVVSQEEVRRLASLSKLNITRAEEEKLRRELSSILDYFRVVDGATAQVAPPRLTRTPGELRPDEARASDPEGALRGVPQKKGRLVKAPRVF